MRNTDYNQDEQFRQRLERFLDRLLTVHGCSREETRFSKDELQGTYEQKTLRRSNFTLIHGDVPD